MEQQLLGDEAFVEEITKKSSLVLRKKRRAGEFTLDEIAAALEKSIHVHIEQVRGKGKSEKIKKGKQLFALASNEYGYKGKEIAAFLGKDPSVVTRYLREKKGLEKELCEVLDLLPRSD